MRLALRRVQTTVILLALALVGAAAVAAAWHESSPWFGALGAVQLVLLVVVGALVVRSAGDRRQAYEVNRQLNRNLTEERALSRTDALTGLLNFRAFTEELVRERARGRRSGQTLTLAYIDLDQFKRVNDTLGHPAGDTLLANVGQVIRDSIRAGDVAARVGGDEFAVLLPATPAEHVHEIAGRINAGIERLTAVRFNPALGASIGLCEVAPADELSVPEIVNRADLAMYEAKAAGRRRRVVFHEPIPVTPEARPPAAEDSPGLGLFPRRARAAAWRLLLERRVSLDPGTSR